MLNSDPPNVYIYKVDKVENINRVKKDPEIQHCISDMETHLLEILQSSQKNESIYISVLTRIAADKLMSRFRARLIGWIELIVNAHKNRALRFSESVCRHYTTNFGQRQIALRIVGHHFSSRLTATLNLCLIYLKLLVHVL